MNLVVPINLQALRVTPNDAAMVTKRADLFAGPTTSFEQLPWRDADYTDHPGRLSRANLSANVVNPLWGGVTEQLDAGVHLHWQLPDALTRGTQQSDGSLAWPAVPNRWLVTRILQQGTTSTARQWIVESDRLMLEADYVGSYYPTAHRKSVAVPSGWSLIAGNDPQTAGGALYYPPWRRMGRVFELAGWQPVATPAGATPDQVLHLDALQRQVNAFAQGLAPGPLKAVGAGGPAFAAYYPDCRSAFGFHDRFEELALDTAAFTASYVVIGWHSRAADDPLHTIAFTDALAKASAANAQADDAVKVDAAHVAAATVLDLYRWHYDPAVGTPDRCLYGAQLSGLIWDGPAAGAGGNPEFPQCYLQPLQPDPSARLAVGNSVSSALAALVKHEWATWVKSEWAPGDAAVEIDPAIEDNLEFLLDALQLGLLHRLGSSSLPELEQALHQSAFGSRGGGQVWGIRSTASDSDKTDPNRFDTPVAGLPANDDGLGDKLAALNGCQRRLEEVLLTIDTARRQLFLDWYHYIAAVGSADPNDATNALKEELKSYISRQILDLWPKFEAAFGRKSAPSLATGNLPIFYADAAGWLSFDGTRYASPAPLPSLAAQVAAAANALLDVLAAPAYAKFELTRTEGPRFWHPNEPIVVATGDGLRPPQRNGTARHLPCRLTPQLVSALAFQAPAQVSVGAEAAAQAYALAVPTYPDAAQPEAEDAEPLLADIKAMLGEACLLDPLLASSLAARQARIAEAGADVQAATRQVAQAIAQAWQAGPPSDTASAPTILIDPAASVGSVKLGLIGQAPQGLAITLPSSDGWQDPFLPLFLVWNVGYQAFQKGPAAGATRYGPGFVTDRFALDEDSIDLVPLNGIPATAGGSASFGGAIPISSRASQPLIDQIRQYLENADTNPQLQAVIDRLKGKPLLSQGLSGINPGMMSHAEGMQLAVFNPFYDAEPPATDLGAGTDTLDYRNVLTHFVGAAAAGVADRIPLDQAGFNPLRAGLMTIVSADVVDVFGRRRRIVDGSAADRAKIAVSAQLQPPGDTGAPLWLPPRLSEPARLRFEWVSGNDARLVTNSDPATSPVAGWVVANHLDNSVMLFAPSGRSLGSAGVFGAQQQVSWQSPPGSPGRAMADDMAGDDLAHLRKFASFVLGKDRAFFMALMASIDQAHTYILADGAAGDPPYAVLMGHPLALVRAELRLEAAGLPGVNSGLDATQAAMTANGAAAYDWTLRDDAGLSAVDFPVRLGDRNQLSDGLVGYFLDSDAPYATFFAPASDGSAPGIAPPAPDTLRLNLRPALDPPPAPFPDAPSQVAALVDTRQRSAGLAVTMLIDPRASVHATTGVLPAKAIDLPAGLYEQALAAIEVAFFTHPVLRGAQGLELPIPDEPGFDWHWAITAAGQAQQEPLLPSQTGDRAAFGFSRQIAQDGWLTLVPKPPEQGAAK